MTGAVEPTPEERERAAHAALSAGITLEEANTEEADEEAKKFGTAEVDYIYEQPPEELFRRTASAVHFGDAVSRDVGVGGCGACGAYDGDGFGDQQCIRHD